MKIRPILFNTPMVKAIKADTKTQTRRAIKSKSAEMTALMMNILSGANYEKSVQELIKNHCPVSVNDVFWVRETWAELGNFASDHYANSEVIGYKTKEAFFYENGRKLDTSYWNWDKVKWKPSIFMPKKICREFLEVKNIRVEVLQDISELDAKAEGIIYDEDSGYYFVVDGKNMSQSAYTCFEQLWIQINGIKNWNLNPLVWVYEFEKTEKPITF